jgi:hypothetical protein
MEATNFDAAARVFASASSRRRALRLLAVGALGAWFPRHGLAAPARQNETCDPGLTYCEEQPGWAPAGCYDLTSDYLHCGDCMHQCPSAGPVGVECIGGACTVVNCGDLTDCTGNLDCTDLTSDPNNCGDCGVVCPSGVCEAGGCTPIETTCGEGLAYCPAKVITIGFNDEPYEVSAGCFDLFSDNIHCGECDITCATTVPCYAGECRLPPA